MERNGLANATMQSCTGQYASHKLSVATKSLKCGLSTLRDVITVKDIPAFKGLVWKKNIKYLINKLYIDYMLR